MEITRQVKYFIHDDDIVIEDSGDFIYIDHAADRFLLPIAAIDDLIEVLNEIKAEREKA